jgi:para-nitrobenzyl esterase
VEGFLIIKRRFKALFSFVIVSLSVLLSACQPGDEHVISTSLGQLSGKADGQVRAYLGVPYAEVPTAERRWAPPLAKKPWAGVKKAWLSRSACVQGGKPTGAFGSSENCLYLDVWTPETPGPHPVMLWLHGGGLLLGAGTEIHYNGANLAKNHNVVVVSINYRLSYLGFLAHPELRSAETYDGSGNQGFLDQLEAIKFVKQEIANFGGDPENITLFGESGGAISACILLSSPLSDGLFQKVIMESGACNSFATRTQQQAEAQGIALFEQLGCPAGEGQLACARALSEEKLESLLKPPANELFLRPQNEWVYNPGPAIDQHLLPDEPVKLLKQGVNPDVPVLLGSNKNEGSLFVIGRDFIDTEDAHRAYLEKWFPAWADDLWQEYPLADYGGKSGEAGAAIAGDGFISCPVQYAAQLLAAGGHQVYNYQFTQKVSSILPTFFSLIKGENGPDFGTFHSSEIAYVFGNRSVFGTFKSPAQKLLKETMGAYWTNFARTGNPNQNGLPLWPIFTPEQKAYLQLNSEFEAKNDLLSGQCDYWINQVFEAED